MIVGWALGGEALTGEMLLATVLIVISVYVVLFRKTGAAKVALEEAVVEGTAGEP
jgi:drug/metabolite transporter (DMT)-like permease